MFAVFFLRYTIDSACLVGKQLVVAGSQVVYIRDVVVQAGEHQLGVFASLFAYPCQVCAHRFITPCIASMFLLSRSTFREDLRSAVVSRFIARPLRLSGPHHSRRGRPDSLFLHWAWYSGMVRSITQEPGNVARLVTCLSLSSSMLSGTPGCRLCARPLRARRMACARMEGIGTFPIFKVFGAMGQIQGIHPSPRCSCLSSLLLSLSVVTLPSG